MPPWPVCLKTSRSARLRTEPSPWSRSSNPVKASPLLPVEVPVHGVAAEATPTPTAAVVTKARQSEERQAAARAAPRVAVGDAAVEALAAAEVTVEAVAAEVVVVVGVARVRAVALRLLLLTRGWLGPLACPPLFQALCTTRLSSQTTSPGAKTDAMGFKVLAGSWRGLLSSPRA